MHCHRQCPQPCSRPQPTHASARDCQILMGKYGSVSCGVTAFFSLVLVCIWVLSLPSKSLFPQSCVSFGSPMVGFMATFSKGLCHTQVCCTQGPCPCGRPLLTRTSAGDTQTLKGRSGSVSVGTPGVHKILFEPSEHLWWVWGLILNEISPLLLSCWGFSFAHGCGVIFEAKDGEALYNG